MLKCEMEVEEKWRWERTKGNGVDDLGVRRGREAHKEQKTRGERDWKGRLRWQAIPISSL